MTVIRKNSKPLSETHPELVKEWDYEKNALLSPDYITAGSGLKIWWKCSNNHMWEAVIFSRARGNGCPYCSNRKALPGFNDLATLHSNIACEWNFQKNKNLTPSDVTSNSGKKVWWRCIHGHEWMSTIDHRVARGDGCPYCSGRKVLAGYNDLATLNPDLVVEWNYIRNKKLSPSDVTSGSEKKIWWKCSEGHEWQSAVYVRTQGSGCPYCSGKKVIRGTNDLMTTNPELAKEWDYEKNKQLTPYDVVAGSEKKVWWRGDCGHSWKRSVFDRVKQGFSLCPYCVGQRVLKGYNDLATVNPDLASEWDYEKNAGLTSKSGKDISTPDRVRRSANYKVWWKCKYGHSWQATINSRDSRNDCPLCGGKGTSMPEQTLAYYIEMGTRIEQRCKINKREVDIYLPEYTIAIEYDGIYYHQDEDRDNVKSRLLSESGITLIRIKESKDPMNRVEGYNIFFQLDDSKKNFEWACNELLGMLEKLTGNDVFGRIDVNVKRDFTSIRERFNLKSKENSILYKYPEIAKQWDMEKNEPLKPDMFTAGSHQSVWWICDYGHEWQATIHNRTGLNKNKCPICSNRKVLPGFNDLATINPELVKEWNYDKNGDLLPTNILSKTNKYVWWKCVRGHEWSASVNSRAYGSKCPFCSGQRVVKGVNDLNTKFPEIASQWNYTRNGDLAPSDVLPFSAKKVWWICSEGHEWEEKVIYRTRRKKILCPICSGKAIN